MFHVALEKRPTLEFIELQSEQVKTSEHSSQNNSFYNHELPPFHVPVIINF